MPRKPMSATPMKRHSSPADAGLRRLAFVAGLAVGLSAALGAYASASRFDPPAALERPAGWQPDPIAAADNSVPAAWTALRTSRAQPEAPRAPSF